MPVDSEQIRKALDHFENDEFTDSKEILRKEFSKAKNDFVVDKLGLKSDLNKDEE